MESDNKKIQNIEKVLPELRYDLISKNWVVLAANRAKRPEAFKKKKRATKSLKSKCPFCNLKKEEVPVLAFSHGKRMDLSKGLKDWTTIVLPNKYPIFTPGTKLNKRREGDFYETINALGHHEVVVTKDHEKSMATFSVSQIKEVIDVYQLRYFDLMSKPFVNHIAIFHNHGAGAGASLSHPHSQIITAPLVDVDLKNAVSNSRKYYRKHRKCIYCEMNKWERKVRKRIIFENKHFIATCPFASKAAFQVIVSPKEHLPYFEKIKEAEKKSLAEAFKAVLSKLHKGLNDPSYNFYLHTAPCDGKEYPSYHWHWTFLPKTSTWAGFELGSQMEVLIVAPEDAAKYLRKQ